MHLIPIATFGNPPTYHPPGNRTAYHIMLIGIAFGTGSLYGRLIGGVDPLLSVAV